MICKWMRNKIGGVCKCSSSSFTFLQFILMQFRKQRGLVAQWSYNWTAARESDNEIISQVHPPQLVMFLRRKTSNGKLHGIHLSVNEDGSFHEQDWFMDISLQLSQSVAAHEMHDSTVPIGWVYTYCFFDWIPIWGAIQWRFPLIILHDLNFFQPYFGSRRKIDCYVYFEGVETKRRNSNVSKFTLMMLRAI